MIGFVQNYQKVIVNFGNFVNTYLYGFATIQIVKTPNTLYSFCYTPQNYLMKYLLQKDSSSTAVFLPLKNNETTHKGTYGDFVGCFLLFYGQLCCQISQIIVK